ncbi:MAG: protein phosphatase CheZ [Deltaproteobacteria bacterium]|nr:protein phosphatase CheZ [Deltaproteobacteria bacterium]
MNNMIMANLDGDLERVAFRMEDIQRIIDREKANLVFSGDDSGLYLEYEGQVHPVQGLMNKENIKAFFIILHSGITFNAYNYHLLFNVKELSNHILTGIDSSGREHLCHEYMPGSEKQREPSQVIIQEIDHKIRMGDLGQEDIEILKDMIHKLREGEFFELLTMDFSGKIKDVARELIDFRKDIQKKIEPEIVEIASKDIPEASNQLEGINETLEDSTMKIMDINEDQMEMANKQYKFLESFVNGNGNHEAAATTITLDETLDVINKQMAVLKNIETLSLNMMEPLSFQDLVGQRIQKIIKLVRSMELRIEELIVSFGIRLQKHKEDPTKTYADLNQDVEAFLNELKGPQRAGEGLDQAGIDDLLASL